VVEGERYPRQRGHYDRRGPLGRVMMLQSAALHVNVDLGRRPLEAWRAANRLAPLLVALFANSPRRCGASVPHRSHRAALWRRLDPTRTGLFDPPEGEARDPIQAYLDFALDAEAFLLGPRDRRARPFREWWRAGTVGVDEFRRHLTTLFPEVRPRGYLEIRSIDALPARWCTVAGAVVTSLIHGPGAREALLNRIPRATPDRLERAGRLGLGDRELLQEVRWLRDRVQDGLRELGPAVSDPSLQRTVTAFFDVFPRRGLDPGAAPESWMGS
ncbi:MAG: glutamate-cysteine ligase family protein, partial [Gemmatimonadota bacterium]